MIRTPEALIPYILMIALVLGGMAWNLSDRMSGPLTVTTGEASIGGPFTLTDQNGAVRTDKDFRGRWMLVYFGYTHCPDVCPLSLEMMGDTLAKLGPKAKKIVPIFVTVDPARDTPPVLKPYMAAFGKNFVGLTGTPEEIDAVTKEYRVYFRKHPLPGGDYSMDHSSQIYLMDPNGKFAMDYTEVDGPDKVAADLAKRL
ncbi:MAG TPA: SCO family protein [Rhizomicrobium sp.]|nr:SCO family protein [Rhizomicrobium sp.]